MNDASDNFTDSSDVLERPLIDAAWAQFEALAGRHIPASTEGRGSFAVPGYRILQEIHRGGQGVIYQAMQDSTQRKVAIKILRKGPLADHTELARFDREVDVLSRLNHPHIVAIHDRGLAAGNAYFVMDYIPGRPLDAYATAEALSTREVLSLCHKICEAVNTAHLRGVIHRDLKPGNIRIDEEGEPHVLDFGLAKFVRDTSSSVDAMTMTGHFVGSLPWASPEQAEGRSDLLDIRTDVYSLGVIIYHLLAGCFPYPVSGRMDDVVRNIMHTSPARPSTLARDIDRDVEVILLKSLAKDPERRYQSAGELARDIQRYLSGEVIEARPAGTFYQLRQFARRNKTLVTSVIAVVLILSAATTVSVAFAFRAAAAHDRERLALVGEVEQRERADREASQTRAVADFQGQMLADIDPQTMGVKLREDVLMKVRAVAERSGRTPEEIDARIKELEKLIAGIDLTGMALTTLDENIFQRALAAIEKQFADQPLIQAQLLQTIASTQRDLGLLNAVSQPQEEALAIRRRVLGDDHPDTLASLNSIGFLLQAQGKPAEAEPYFREALEGYRRVLGDGHPDTLQSIIYRGNWLSGRGMWTEAERYFREALEGYRRVLGNEHPDTLESINKMGFVLNAQGKPAEAEPYYREVLETRRRVLGDEHIDTLRSIGNMAYVLRSMGMLTEAKTYSSEALEGYRCILGNGHHDALTLIGNIGGLLQAQGDLTEAEPYYREALEMRRHVLGDNHPDTLNSMGTLSYLLRGQGKLAEAELYSREALAIRRRVLGDEHPKTLNAIISLGVLLKDQGKLAESESYCREVLEKRHRVLRDELPDTLLALYNLGGLLQAQGKPTEVVELLAPAEPAARRAFTGGIAHHLGLFLTTLGHARVAIGEFDAADANLNEAHAILSEAKGATKADRTDVLRGLVELYDAWHAAEPDRGYDAKAAELRAKLTVG